MLNRKDGSLVTIFAFYLTLCLNINYGINKTKQAFFNHPDCSSESRWYPLLQHWFLASHLGFRQVPRFFLADPPAPTNQS